MEQFRELYWEALRAPDTMVTMDRNPYRREKLIKKMFGRTKEERMLRSKELNAQVDAHKSHVDKEILEAEIYSKGKLSAA